MEKVQMHANTFDIKEAKDTIRASSTTWVAHKGASNYQFRYTKAHKTLVETQK